MLKPAACVALLAGLCSFTHATTIAIEQPHPMKADFAINLYQTLAKEQGNLFFSPISIQSALAMTALGAKGDTAKEMNDVIQIGDPMGFANMVAVMQQTPQKNRPKLQLSIANAIWSAQNYPFSPDFMREAKRMFFAQTSSLDFSQPAAARKTINGWVEDKTKEKIKDLLPDGAITPDTRLILTNAVYFKADWASQFSKEITQEAPFHVASAKPATRDPEGFSGKMVQMMHQTLKFSYADAGDYHLVAMAYDGHTTSMLLLVPKEMRGLAKVEAGLSAKSLGEAIEQCAPRKISLYLPKFKIEQSVSLSKTLQSMGMKLPFDAEKADFSGMTTGEKLAISDVLHKAYVDVDENGTEAAAATAVMMAATSAPPMQEDEPLEIKADHPFIFIVRDNTSGAILFMGRVADPLP